MDKKNPPAEGTTGGQVNAIGRLMLYSQIDCSNVSGTDNPKGSMRPMHARRFCARRRKKPAGVKTAGFDQFSRGESGSAIKWYVRSIKKCLATLSAGSSSLLDLLALVLRLAVNEIPRASG